LFYYFKEPREEPKGKKRPVSCFRREGQPEGIGERGEKGGTHRESCGRGAPELSVRGGGKRDVTVRGEKREFVAPTGAVETTPEKAQENLKERKEESQRHLGRGKRGLARVLTRESGPQSSKGIPGAMERKSRLFARKGGLPMREKGGRQGIR